MSCRENPASSALVSLCTNAYRGRLTETQVKSVFHEARAKVSKDTEPPTREEYQAFLRSLAASLTDEDRTQVQERLDKAMAGPVPDGRTYAAMGLVRGQCAAASQAMTVAIRRSATARLDPEHLASSSGKFLIAAETKTMRARYEAFCRDAEADRTLRAPAGWIEQYKSSPGVRAVPKDRVTAYGLWRSERSGADFAPPAPDGTAYTTVTVSWDDLRPGDVIDAPGFRAPGDVTHEGKVVSALDEPTYVPDPSPTGVRRVRRVTFTDGTHEDRVASQFTVLRPHTPEQEAALDRYRQVQSRALLSGRDDRGWFAEDPDTGERVYHP